MKSSASEGSWLVLSPAFLSAIPWGQVDKIPQLHQKMLLAESHPVDRVLFCTAWFQWQHAWIPLSSPERFQPEPDSLWSQSNSCAPHSFTLRGIHKKFISFLSTRKSFHLSARQSLFDQPQTGCLRVNALLPAARCNLCSFPGMISFVFHPQVFLHITSSADWDNLHTVGAH